MGQVEVLNWLREQRECERHQYFSVKDIEKGLKEKGHSGGTIQNVCNNVRVLYLWGKLELEPLPITKEIRTWRYMVRIKESEM